VRPLILFKLTEKLSELSICMFDLYFALGGGTLITNWEHPNLLTLSPSIKAVAGPPGQDKLSVALPHHVSYAYKHFPPH